MDEGEYAMIVAGENAEMLRLAVEMKQPDIPRLRLTPHRAGCKQFFQPVTKRFSVGLAAVMAHIMEMQQRSVPRS